MTLQESKCEACRIDAPLVTESEKTKFLSELNGWEINNIEGIDQLAKVFSFDNYLQALDFAKGTSSRSSFYLHYCPNTAEPEQGAGPIESGQAHRCKGAAEMGNVNRK